MTTQSYPALSQFLGAYFHQDWPEEFPDPESAIAAFRRKEPPELVRTACSELDQAHCEAQQSADPSKLLAELGCYYDPQADGRSVPQWLAHVRTKLAAA